MNKAIIFDASTIISFGLSGLLSEFRSLKQAFGGEFIVPKEVQVEVIDRPLKIERFKLEGLMVRQLFEEGIFTSPEKLGYSNPTISKETQKILSLVNDSFISKGKSLHLIDAGEASCLALSRMLQEKNIPHAVAVDERTTRLLCEDPDALYAHLQRRLHTKISIRRSQINGLRDIPCLRSAELAYILAKKKLFSIQDKRMFDAALHALKSNGAALRYAEIEQLEQALR